MLTRLECSSWHSFCLLASLKLLIGRKIVIIKLCAKNIPYTTKLRRLSLNHRLLIVFVFFLQIGTISILFSFYWTKGFTLPKISLSSLSCSRYYKLYCKYYKLYHKCFQHAYPTRLKSSKHSKMPALTIIYDHNMFIVEASGHLV
jgi:hypothetical protein